MFYYNISLSTEIRHLFREEGAVYLVPGAANCLVHFPKCDDTKFILPYFYYYNVLIVPKINTFIYFNYIL